MTTQPHETIFTVTWQYVAYSLLTYGAASLMILMPFIADIGLASGLVTVVVFVAEIVGLVWLVWRFTKCGIFVDHEGVKLRTVTRTTSIPFSRFRIYEDRVSFAAKADLVPVLSDTNGRTVKAGVLTGLEHADKLGIVRTILHIRNATAAAAAEHD